MTRPAEKPVPREARQALWLWVTFFCLAVAINGTLPFLAGVDLHAWTYSKWKGALFDPLIYGCVFMVGPVLLVKGRSAARQPSVAIALVIGVAALAVRPFARPAAVVALLVLIYLHMRHDLSSLGIASPWSRRGLAAILILGLLPLAVRGMAPQAWGWHPSVALLAALDRLLLNPASTSENLFYFGLLTERLEPWTGRWKTPLLIGALYTAHEMSNPEYWYEGMNFLVVFIGVGITAAVYLWCRSVVAIWLSSGLARFVTRLW